MNTRHGAPNTMEGETGKLKSMTLHLPKYPKRQIAANPHAA